MKLLLVKLSSLGDVVHVLPALTDAARACADLEVHWVVEEGFQAIARLHPAVSNVVPIALRRWRGRPLDAGAEIRTALRRLRGIRYDLVLDAQGLLKSAVIARLARGPRVGFDVDSARERIACVVYNKHIPVPRQQHAINRQRGLFAAALRYPLPAGPIDYGVRSERLAAAGLVLLHGTTWNNKLWPEPFWSELANRALARGVPVTLTWGNAVDRQRAERIAAQAPGARVTPSLDLCAIIGLLGRSAAAVSVDSGLGHLAAALRVPTIALYGPTDANLTGCVGATVVNLAAEFRCAPCLRRLCSYRGTPVFVNERAIEPACFSTVTPDRVWQRLSPWLASQ